MGTSGIDYSACIGYSRRCVATTYATTRLETNRPTVAQRCTYIRRMSRDDPMVFFFIMHKLQFRRV